MSELKSPGFIFAAVDAGLIVVASAAIGSELSKIKKDVNTLKETNKLKDADNPELIAINNKINLNSAKIDYIYVGLSNLIKHLNIDEKIIYPQFDNIDIQKLPTNIENIDKQSPKVVETISDDDVDDILNSI